VAGVRAPSHDVGRFYAGAVLLVALVVANVVSHVIPGWLILPAGLCLGEVRAHAWQAMRGER
jgi:hypothetical protein